MSRWFTKFGAKRTPPVVWAEYQFIFWHEYLRNEPPRSTQGLFSTQNTTGVLLI